MIGEMLKKNIEAIAQCNLFILPEILTTDFSQLGNGVVEKSTAAGRQDVYFQLENQQYLLHSRYDPTAEAKRLTQNIEETRDHLVVVFGIGLGHHLFELNRKLSKDSRVIIVEHNVDVLKYALNHIDFSDIFASGKFVLFYGDEQQIAKMALNLARMNYYNLVHNMQAIALPNYYVYAAQNQQAMQDIAGRLLNTVLCYGNDLQDNFVGFSNMCHNTRAILKSHSMADIKDKFKNVPAFIVAAGPSLDKNIQHLKKANGKALIIACDASRRACEKHGVRPDAIASIERDEPTYTYYYKDQIFPDDLVLVGPGTLWPTIYDEYPGKTIIVSRTDSGFEQMWLSTFEHFKFSSVGHSCATVAFGLARDAGCNPIILVGQDLAYTSGKKHSNLTHTEFEGDNDDRDSTGIYLEDAEGNLLKSHIVYKIFKEWYELQILSDYSLQVINATEGGAYIKGTTLMTLEDAIEKYCKESIDKRLVEYLPEKKISFKDKLKKYELLDKTITRNFNLLKKIRQLALTHVNMLVKMEKKVYQTTDEQELTKIVLKLQRGDKIIQKILDSNSIEGYYKQIIIQTIVQVKKIGNELTAENVRRNHFLQHNLMFMIVNSTDLIIKEYSNAKEIIAQDKQQIVIDDEEEMSCTILS